MGEIWGGHEDGLRKLGFPSAKADLQQTARTVSAHGALSLPHVTRGVLAIRRERWTTSVAAGHPAGIMRNVCRLSAVVRVRSGSAVAVAVVQGVIMFELGTDGPSVIV